MSQNIIRKDKTCLNCRHVVQERFCPNCGQENSESRKTFLHLFIHFFEDLTHYENAFWRTIKNLLFRPASLTKEYLSGKRLSYLAPVRLYIFISFVTFFLIAVSPDSEKPDDVTAKKEKILKTNSHKIAANREDINDSIGATKINNRKLNKFFNFGYKSVAELDSLQKFGKKDEHLNTFEYWVVKKAIIVTKTNTSKELILKFKESFVHNFSKTLFIYMPIFAFFLWLFHGKKKWYYFDHGIFTLHYFSFLLLVYLLIFLINTVFDLFNSSIVDSIISIFNFVAVAWMVYYFFPAHHRFYGETRKISFLKSVMLFFINMFLIIIILTLFAIYTFINLH